jgi:6-phosphogluconolactonase
MEWASWNVYFADERACPPDDPASNYHLATTTLLSLVPIDPAHVHRMSGERPDLDAAAIEYSALLAGSLPSGPGGAPRLDVILLGLGENGHTASLFPGTPALGVTDRWATRGLADYEPFDRITLTYPAINAAAAVAFMVTGAGKDEALLATARGEVPASRVRPTDGTLTWFLDAVAAGA